MTSELLENRRGMTLIELLLVVTLTGILLAGGAVFSSGFLSLNAQTNTVDQLVQTLRKAQMYAMVSRKGNTAGWGVDYTQPVITLYQGSSFASRDPTLDETFTVPGSVTISPAPFEVNFARGTGLPSPAPLTITVGGLTSSKTVTVNAQGMISR